MYCSGCSAARSTWRFGPCTPRATRPRRPCVRAQHFDQQAALAPGPRVQDVGAARPRCALQSNPRHRRSVVVAEACAARLRRPTSLRARAPRFPGTPCGRTGVPSARARACRSRAGARRPCRSRSPSGRRARPRSPRRCAAAPPSSSTKLLDLHRRRIRQLLAELAHQLLAHQFAGEEALALVGDLVLGVQRGLLPAPAPAGRRPAPPVPCA